MQDVQNRVDKRGIAIQRVGISDVYLPLQIKQEQHSQPPIGQAEIGNILDEAITKLSSNSAHLSMSFKYFIEKTAPVSGKNLYWI